PVDAARANHRRRPRSSRVGGRRTQRAPRHFEHPIPPPEVSGITIRTPTNATVDDCIRRGNGQAVRPNGAGDLPAAIRDLADVLQLVGDAAAIVRPPAAATWAAAATPATAAGPRPGAAHRDRLDESRRKLIEPREVEAERPADQEIHPGLD